MPHIQFPFDLAQKDKIARKFNLPKKLQCKIFILKMTLFI